MEEIKTKICKMCNLEKPLNKFQINNKVCSRCKSQKNYKADYFKTYYKEHKDDINFKEYYEQNKDKFKIYYEQKKESLKEQYKIKHANDIPKKRGRPKKDLE